MINELSEEQIAKLPKYRDEWIRIGLSTEPLDFERAKNAAILAYQSAGLEAPKLFLRFRDPIEAAMAAAMLRDDQVRDQVRNQVRDQVRGQVSGQVRDQVWDQVMGQVSGQVWDQVMDQVRDQVSGQVWDQVMGQVRDQVRDQVSGQVRDQVRDQVMGQVSGQVWDQVWGQVMGQVRDQVSGQVRDQVYGSHDAGWLSFYVFMRDELNIADCRKLDGLIELAKCCGWWAPYSGCVIFQDRHNILNLDDFGRIHCENGPAIAYPSGWSIYAIHGVRTTEQAIMRPETLTIADIKSESNAERRRVLVERMGYERYLAEGQVKVIDRDFVDIQVGAGRPMPRCLIEDQFKDRYLFGTDGSTERAYFMPVPNRSTTCRMAHEAICGLDESLCIAQS